MASPIATCVLLAAGFDWLEALLPFAFVLFWIVSQVLSAIRRVQGGNGRRPPQPLPRVEPPRAPAGPVPDEAADWRGELERQIAEFLRESQGRPGERPPEKNAPRPAAPAPRSGETATRDRGRDKTRSAKPPVAARPAPAPVKPSSAKPASVSASGTAVAGGESAAKDSVARHVKDAFGRSLSHLEGGLVHDAPPMIGDPAAKAAAAATDDFVRMLRNPATIRQVILMREVLDRPVDRW